MPDVTASCTCPSATAPPTCTLLLARTCSVSTPEPVPMAARGADLHRSVRSLRHRPQSDPASTSRSFPWASATCPTISHARLRRPTKATPAPARAPPTAYPTFSRSLPISASDPLNHILPDATAPARQSSAARPALLPRRPTQSTKATSPPRTPGAASRTPGSASRTRASSSRPRPTSLGRRESSPRTPGSASRTPGSARGLGLPRRGPRPPPRGVASPRRGLRRPSRGPWLPPRGLALPRRGPRPTSSGRGESSPRTPEFFTRTLASSSRTRASSPGTPPSSEIDAPRFHRSGTSAS